VKLDRKILHERASYSAPTSTRPSRTAHSAACVREVTISGALTIPDAAHR
jgi:hypothetical protein